MIPFSKGEAGGRLQLLPADEGGVGEGKQIGRTMAALPIATPGRGLSARLVPLAITPLPAILRRDR